MQSPPEIVKKTIQHVMRAFYSPQDVIFVDYLLEHQPTAIFDTMSEDLGISAGQLNRMIDKLLKERIINRRIRYPSPDKKEIHLSMLYDHVLNFFKLKLYLIEKEFEKTQEQSAHFECRDCGAVYDEYQMARIFTTSMKCDECDGENIEEQLEVHQSMQIKKLFYKDIGPVKELLKQCDKFIVNIFHRNDIYAIMTKVEFEKRQLQGQSEIKEIIRAEKEGEQTALSGNAIQYVEENDKKKKRFHIKPNAPFFLQSDQEREFAKQQQEIAKQEAFEQEREKREEEKRKAEAIDHHIQVQEGFMRVQLIEQNYVNVLGERFAIEDITEEQLDKMTEAEYEDYEQKCKDRAEANEEDDDWGE